MGVLVTGMLVFLPVVKPTLNRNFTQLTAQDSLIVEEWKKEIANRSRKVSIDSLTAGANVLIFGENHEKNFQRYFLASKMQEFHEKGYSCLCLEMPSDWQEYLHFMRMIVKLRNMGGEVSQGEEMFLNFLRSHYPDKTAESMYVLIDAAYSVGMEVYAIDVPSNEIPTPYNYPFWLIDKREEYMAEMVKKIMRNSEKPIVLVGAMHYGLANILLSSRFATFSSADSVDLFYRAASALEIRDTIMINDGRYSVIYIPEK
ncbi:MAG: hypothetical protein QXL47_00560 [Candidatus Anstonellales archaeon]